MVGLFRVERDHLGELHVPAHAYYGVHTARAMTNFAVTGEPIAAWPELVSALAAVKAAAAQANHALGVLPGAKADAIAAACTEIRNGLLHEHFVVDLIQGGAGTSTNMNANEVICNRALELLGYPRGEYRFLDPIEDVNRSQSTNDVYPTAVRLAAFASTTALLQSVAELRHRLAEKAAAFTGVVKLGRTQLQDAVPMSLGQELRGYASSIEDTERRLQAAAAGLLEIGLGGTAVGTALNTPSGYVREVLARLAAVTGLPLVPSRDLIAATADVGAFVALSGALRLLAVRLGKICNDLRLLASGPRAGLAEITLPAVQAGSSIMPGKVNPVIPELVNQIAFTVMGYDLTVTLAAEAGQLELNAFGPIITRSLHQSVKCLDAGCRALADRCVAGITANEQHLRDNIERSATVATLLNPLIGYSAANALVTQAMDEGLSIRELVIKRGLLTAEAFDQLVHSSYSSVNSID